MKKILVILILNTITLFAFSSKIQAAYAIGVFDKFGNGENIQHKRTTNKDYNNETFSKIVIFGNFFNSNIQVKIGDSRGHFIKSISIYNSNKIKIAEELTFRHLNVTKGYFEVKIDGKIYDSKVFVK